MPSNSIDKRCVDKPAFTVPEQSGCGYRCSSPAIISIGIGLAGVARPDRVGATIMQLGIFITLAVGVVALNQRMVRRYDRRLRALDQLQPRPFNDRPERWPFPSPRPLTTRHDCSEERGPHAPACGFASLRLQRSFQRIQAVVEVVPPKLLARKLITGVRFRGRSTPAPVVGTPPRHGPTRCFISIGKVERQAFGLVGTPSRAETPVWPNLNSTWYRC